MNLRSFLVFFLIVSLSSLVYSLELSQCQDLNEDYSGQTLVLTQNIDGWVDSCFTFATDNVTLNCDNHTIDDNSDSVSFFVFDSIPGNQVLFVNCDFNLRHSDLFKRTPNSSIDSITIDNSTFFLGDNFYNNSFKQDNELVFRINDTNINTIRFKDLDFDLTSNFLELQGNVNIAELIFEDSTVILQEDYYFMYLFETVTDNLILDFNNLDLNLLGSLFLADTSNINSISIQNLDTNTNYSDIYSFIFGSYDSNLRYLGFEDSNVIFDGNGVFLNIQSLDSNLILDLGHLDLNMGEYAQLSVLSSAGQDNNYVKVTVLDLDIDENNYNLLNSVFDIAGSFLELDLNRCSILGLEDASIFGFRLPPGLDVKDASEEYLSVNINDSNIEYLRISEFLELYNLNNLPMINYNSGDLNYVAFITTSLYLDNYLLDMSDYDMPSNDNIEETLQLYFEDIDANYISFNDLNIITSGDFDSEGTIMFSESVPELDINYIYLNNSTVIGGNSQPGLATQHLSDDYIHISSSNTIIGGVVGLGTIDSNISRLDIQNVLVGGAYGLGFLRSDINQLNVFDSNIVGHVYGGIAFANNDANIDINLFNSSIIDYLSWDTSCGFYITQNSQYDYMNINNYVTTSDVNAPFCIFDNNDDDGSVDINNLIITDSDFNLGLGFLVTGQNTQLDNLLVYNNVFRNIDLDVNFIGQYLGNILNMDFNSVLDLNKPNRLKLLDDDSNYVGGNLWLDSQGDNLCETDSANPKGICDSSISLIVYDYNNRTYTETTDYLPLIQYDIAGGGNDGGGGSSGGEPKEEYDLKLTQSNSGKLTETIPLDIVISITKIGTKQVTNFDYDIFVYYGTNKEKIIASSNYNNSSLPLEVNENVVWADLLGSKEKYIDNNKIKFEIVVNAKDDNDLTNNTKTFFVDTEYIIKSIKNEDGKDKNIDNNFGLDFNYDSIYLVSYKEKLGVLEQQIITVYDDKNQLLKNIGINILFNDKIYFVITDEFGKAVFVPEIIGTYNIIVPFDDVRVKGTFEVIQGYVSTNGDFVEVFVNKKGSSKLSAAAKIIIYVGSAILLLIIIGITLYFILKPKRNSSYNFEDSDFYKQSEYHLTQMDAKKEIQEAVKEKDIIYKKVNYKYN